MESICGKVPLDGTSSQWWGDKPNFHCPIFFLTFSMLWKDGLFVNRDVLFGNTDKDESDMEIITYMYVISEISIMDKLTKEYLWTPNPGLPTTGTLDVG